MSEIKNKEVSDALYMLLHCAIEDDRYTTQKEQFDVISSYIKELEDRLEARTICGYPIEEAIRILDATSIERAYDIRVTMDNLQKLMKTYQEEQTEMLKKTLSRIDYEWPPGGKEIKIPKIDLKE